MAHYALINKNNIVVEVITGVNENITQTDLDGTTVGGSSEAWERFYETREWFKNLTCKRTSYNGNIRKNFAGIGYTYDWNRDAFIPPQPYPSWILNEDTCRWEAPISYPNDGVMYSWDEEAGDWVAIVFQQENKALN
jgi:hypothetical protein